MRLPLLFILSSSALLAQPQGLERIVGSVETRQLDAHTFVVETGDRAILHWKEFSIAPGETTRFIMPSAHSAVLNRVTGGSQSLIKGFLEANGRVVLINENGFVFDRGSSINTASFIASTLDLFDGDFLKQGELLFTGESRASILNLGCVSAAGGDVALIAYQIDQSGRIEASQGAALLAAGSEVLLRPDGHERIFIRPSLGEQGGMEQSGTIQALIAELKADGNPYQCAIRERGTIDATSVEDRNGRIFLVANRGAISASGSYLAPGGEVQFTADVVHLQDGASVSVSGEQMGGSVLVQADIGMISPTATISADAKTYGNGGEVLLWGEQALGFFGSISACGGQEGGDGGFVEVSSPNQLVYQGITTTRAPQGMTGELLLDPCAVTISNGTDSGYSFTSCPTSATFTGASAVINNGSLGTALDSCSVTINASATGTASAGTITITSPITWTEPNTLTLIASDSSSVIQIQNLITLPAGGALSINDNNSYAMQLSIGSITNDSGIVGPTSGSATVTLEASNIALSGENGFASYITNQSGGTLAVNISMQGSDPFMLTGGVANSSPAYLVADSLSLSTNYGVVMEGGGGTNSYAKMSSTSTISLQLGSTDGLTITGGAGTGSYAQMVAGGDISIDGFDAMSNPQIQISAASSGGQAELFTTGAGNILIGQSSTLGKPGGLTLIGESNYASLYTENGAITITLETGGGDLGITAGSGTSSYASIESGSTIHCTVPGLSLVSGTSSTAHGSDAYIQAVGSITIAANTTTSISSNSPSVEQDTFIKTTGTNSDLTFSCATSGLTIGDTNQDNTPCYFVATGNISISLPDSSRGSLSVNGTNTNSPAYIQAGGNVSLNCSAGVGLQGGGDNSYGAIQAGGTIAIQYGGGSGGCSLTGGTGTNAYASVFCPGRLTIDGYNSTISGDLALSSSASPAKIYTTGGGDILIGKNGNLAPPALLCSGSGSTPAASQIATLMGGDIEISTGAGDTTLSLPGIALGEVMLDSSTFQAPASVLTQQGGNITCNTTGDCVITGGSLSGMTAFIEAATTGNITLTCANLTITGGTSSSGAGITTSDGDIQITGSGNCTMSATAVDSEAKLEALGSNITLTFTGNASFGNFTTVTTPAPSGNLLIIAGGNLTVSGNAQIEALGTTSSSLTLVCDNSYPSPEIGPGEFNLGASATVSAGTGTPVRIFTSERGQNTISGPINGVTYEPGPLFINSATEQWETYYPSSFGGSPYTLFYKNGSSTPSPSGGGIAINFTQAAVITAIRSSQLFFDLGQLDFFYFYDWFRWSDFVTDLNKQRGGHSLRRRPELLKETPALRGFVL